MEKTLLYPLTEICVLNYSCELQELKLASLFFEKIVPHPFLILENTLPEDILYVDYSKIKNNWPTIEKTVPHYDYYKSMDCRETWYNITKNNNAFDNKYVFLGDDDFSSMASSNDINPSSRQLIYEAIIDNLKMIDTNNVSWEQICEFREDKDSVNKFRRFRLFVYELLKTPNVNSRHFYSDLLSVMMEDYEYAAKKHNFIFSSGIFRQLLNPSYIVTIAGGAGLTKLLTNDSWAIFVASALSLTGLTISIIENMLNAKSIEHGKSGEISYLIKLKSTLR
jgi:hypothetical protein